MPVVMINGLGLIGSSIARTIKQSAPDARIIGADLDAANLQFLLDQHVIDATASFAAGCSQADVIILATPVDQICHSLAQLTSIELKPTAVVTDVGSSKQQIMRAAQPLIDQGKRFLGGYPMAGSHLTGGRNGTVQILAHHSYFLVNGNATAQQEHLLTRLLAAGQFHFIKTSATEHDQIVSAVSHLPHAIAFALINTLAPLGIDPKVPAGGLLDTTRIAMGDPKVWSTILTSEPTEIINQINRFEQQLDRLKMLIETDDRGAIERGIKRTNATRHRMEEFK